MHNAYQQLVTELQRLDTLNAIQGILGWDEQVNLPESSSAFRGLQLAEFARIYHRESTAPALGKLLDFLQSDKIELDADQAIVVAEARKNFDLATKVPETFVAKRTEARSRSYHAWVAARKANDFAGFASCLEEQLQLSIEETAFLNASDPYDHWIDRFDPGMDAATIERLFTALQSELKPLVNQITSSSIQADTSMLRGFPEDKQEAFLKDVIAAVGFDFKRGRIDRAVHPFCGGHTLDTRMTTRFDENNPLDSLSSALHETGHALYEQGLAPEYRGTALGESVGMAVHESQSRMWENQVGRGKAFWKFWEPRYRALFPSQLAGVDSNQLYLAINNVSISPIRVDADEVTYNLHIMLRFSLEKQLFTGQLRVRDLPEAWNAASSQILGYTPNSDKEGCLQDVHWSCGMFGYFPSYCLGNMLAAQFWYTILDQVPGLECDFEVGDYSRLLAWLRTHVHSQGKRYQTMAIAQKVTGKPLEHESLIRYLKERYLPLYS
ncbi:MAG: carboxypeptidase M32 [Verrucomicrobia bacterium]|nr:carboxypeptidase M32 [Verrucomicrobiota bacterium]